MGVFDFVKDAGAKVGIGESTAEEEAKVAKAAEEAESKREAAAKKVQDRLNKRKAENKSNEIKERIAESKKAVGLETYVRGLGLEVDGLDIAFDDGVASVTGKVADQATRERVILAIGNTADVERVEDDIDVVDPASESKLHAVVRGDTLWGLAETYLGDGRKYPEIFDANRPMLSDPNKIYVGQVLRIPGAA